MMQRVGAVLLLLAALSAVLALSTVRAADDRTRLYAQAIPPPSEVLDRLNLEMAWRTAIPMDGRRDGFFSTQMVGRDMFVQTRSGLVVLLDADTGVTRWRARVGKPYQTSARLAFNSRSVYVVNSNYLYSLDRNSGAVQWQFSVPAALSAQPVADEEQFYLPTSSGRLYAYYLPRREAPVLPPAEQRPLPPPESEVPAESPGARPTTLYEQGRRSTAAVGPSSGSVREAGGAEVVGPQPALVWDTIPGFRLEWKPLQTSQYLLVPGSDGTAATYSKAGREVDRATDELARFTADADFGADPGQFGETGYLGSRDGNLYALDISTARVQWRYTAGTPINRRPIATTEDVYVASARNGLARLDRGTGDPLWRVPSGNRVLTNQPEADRFLAANPKFVYALDPSGRLLVLDRRLGTRLSQYNVRDFAFPVVNEVTDRLYLAANDGLMVCLHDKAYRTPYRHRKAEEEASNPVRAKLGQPITEPGGKPVPLRDLLDDLRKRYGLKIQLAEQAFKEAGVEGVQTKLVAFPKVDAGPLSEVLQKILSQVNATYQVVDDTILIVPAAKPK